VSVGSASRAALFGTLALLFVLGALLSLFAAPAEMRPKSVASSEPAGRRAALLLLQALERAPAAWTRAPVALPRGGHLLWMPGAPKALTEDGDGDGEGGVSAGERESPLLLDPRHPWHYARFVEEGGTLVLPAGEGAFLEPFLDLDVALPASETSAGPIEIVAPDGERLEIEGLALFAATVDERLGELGLCDSGRSVALALCAGRGRLVLLADDSFLADDRIGERDHALLLVRLIEELARGGRVLFDEFALGRWRPPGKLELALAPGVRGVTLHLAALLALLLWFQAWVREFPRDPEPWTRAGPLVRARSQARLLQRARRYDLLSDMLRRGVLARAAGRARLYAPGRQPVGRAQRLDLAGRLARHCGGADRSSAWREVLVQRTVLGPRALERLARDLERVEAALEERTGMGRRGGAGTSRGGDARADR